MCGRVTDEMLSFRDDDPGLANTEAMVILSNESERLACCSFLML